MTIHRISRPSHITESQEWDVSEDRRYGIVFLLYLCSTIMDTKTWKIYKKFLKTLPIHGSRMGPGEAEKEAAEDFYRKVLKVVRKNGGSYETVTEHVDELETKIKKLDWNPDDEEAWSLVARSLKDIDERVQKDRLEDSEKRLNMTKGLQLPTDVWGHVSSFMPKRASTKKRKRTKKPKKRKKSNKSKKRSRVKFDT
jgi:hypothetical protein